MSLFSIFLVLATFFCSLVAGFLFAFSVVVMPGVRSLSDGEFIRAFQGMDGIIQANNPLFVVVWLGSIVSLIACAVLGAMHSPMVDRIVLFGAAGAYFLMVQLPTFRINIPLNNFIQSLDTSSMDATKFEEARHHFEPRWNWWNKFRTISSSLVVVMLILVLYLS